MSLSKYNANTLNMLFQFQTKNVKRKNVYEFLIFN